MGEHASPVGVSCVYTLESPGRMRRSFAQWKTEGGSCDLSGTLSFSSFNYPFGVFESLFMPGGGLECLFLVRWLNFESILTPPNWFPHRDVVRLHDG